MGAGERLEQGHEAWKTQTSEPPVPGRAAGTANSLTRAWTCGLLGSPASDTVPLRRKERRQPTRSTTAALRGRAEVQIQCAPCLVAHPKSSRTFKCLTHVWKGLLHDCSICRVRRFNLFHPPHTLLTGCGCSWVSHGAFTTHDGGLEVSGPAYAENTHWRSRLQGVIEHFHVVAMIKRLLKSRERHIPPMDSSGL